VHTSKRSVGLVVSIILMFVFSLLTSWTAVSYDQPAYWVWAVASLVAGTGVALAQRWSRFLVYALALVSTVSFAYTTWLAYDSGYFARTDTPNPVISLIVASSPTLLFVGSSLPVWKYFRRNGGSNNALERTREG
jgi:FtsH-binding integral membrane protein